VLKAEHIDEAILHFTENYTSGNILNLCASTPMASTEFLLEEDPEIFEDQIVPDQDDCFLPPSEVVLPSNTWSVSKIIITPLLFLKRIKILLYILQYPHYCFSLTDMLN